MKPNQIADAYDAQAFRAEGHRLVDQLADYLTATESRDLLPVLPDIAPAAMLEAWPTAFSAEGGADFGTLIARTLAQSNHLHHPRYVGHQVTAPLPLGALCDLVGSVLNNGMAVYEMGPVATAMERHIIAWMGNLLGFPSDCGGVLTSGGSAGNLTALLAARQAKAGFDAWGDGNTGGPPLAVLVSEHAHYSVRRSLQIMGCGAGGVVPVAVDDAFRMRPEALADALARAQRAGRRVFAVAASSCSTATGSFDPLAPIADFCAEHDLWLHVDGAHGAPSILSSKYRHLLAGVERADSVVWDAHKMMLTPALATAVVFRDEKRSYEAFAQQASYLFSGGSRDEEWYNVGARTLECTKKMLSLKLYITLSVYGTRMFADYITATYDQAKRFAARLRETEDFEVPVEPECNIVCFRHRPKGVEDLDRLQEDVRRIVLASGKFYLVQTQLPAGRFLRTTLINPRTTDEDLGALLDAVRDAARQRRQSAGATLVRV